MSRSSEIFCRENRLVACARPQMTGALLAGPSSQAVDEGAAREADSQSPWPWLLLLLLLLLLPLLQWLTCCSQGGSARSVPDGALFPEDAPHRGDAEPVKGMERW